MDQNFLALKTSSREVLTELATLSFSALKNNDKVGLILFTDEIEQHIPPKKGRFHILRIIRELLEFKRKAKTDINRALEFFLGIKEKSNNFLMSDFISSDYEKL